MKTVPIKNEGTKMNLEEILPPPRAEAPKPDAPAEPSHPQSIDDQVRELVRLRDAGVLSYEGFAARKAELFSQT